MKITITKKRTGEAVSYEEDGMIDDNVKFLWTEGNYGCDCNRGLFFHRAKGLPDTDNPCNEGLYAVTLDDGHTKVSC